MDDDEATGMSVSRQKVAPICSSLLIDTRRLFFRGAGDSPWQIKEKMQAEAHPIWMRELESHCVDNRTVIVSRDGNATVEYVVALEWFLSGGSRWSRSQNKKGDRYISRRPPLGPIMSNDGGTRDRSFGSRLGFVVTVTAKL
jgi:hypothetical protein